MLKALLSTVTELADSKKWLNSYAAVIFASVLHLHFGVSIESALLLVSPLAVAVASQAHVDAQKAKTTSPIEGVGGDVNLTVVKNEPEAS